jgi:hypothetical protein
MSPDFFTKGSVFFQAGYLTTLSLSILYSVDDRMINESGAVGGMEIGRETEELERRPSQCTFCPPHDLIWEGTRVAYDCPPELCHGSPRC